MPDVTITVKDNGPYLVHGGASILDPDGNEFDVKDQKTIAICRCGEAVRSCWFPKAAFEKEYSVSKRLDAV